MHPSLGRHRILDGESAMLAFGSPHGPGLSIQMPLAELNSIGTQATTGIIQDRLVKFLMELWGQLLFIQSPLGISLRLCAGLCSKVSVQLT